MTRFYLIQFKVYSIKYVQLNSSHSNANKIKMSSICSWMCFPDAVAKEIPLIQNCMLVYSHQTWEKWNDLCNVRNSEIDKTFNLVAPNLSVFCLYPLRLYNFSSWLVQMSKISKCRRALLASSSIPGRTLGNHHLSWL